MSSMGTQKIRHKQWLDNEYSQWVKALQESTVDNFGDHPMVRRMLGGVDRGMFIELVPLRYLPIEVDKALSTIITLGGYFSGNVWRMEYYANKVLSQNPTSICEIGGGVGQFYAVLRALGYKGKYFIFDLQEVKEFQRKYLDRVTKLTGLDTSLEYTDFDYCVSMYALGEFDDELKNWYIENVVKKCPHGLIVWNPHSGASDKITFDCKTEPEYPLTSPGNKLLTW